MHQVSLRTGSSLVVVPKTSFSSKLSVAIHLIFHLYISLVYNLTLYNGHVVQYLVTLTLTRQFLVNKTTRITNPRKHLERIRAHFNSNMARGHPTSPPDAVSVPKVSFTIVSDEISKLPAGVKNKAAIPFGCGSFGFKRDLRELK